MSNSSSEFSDFVVLDKENAKSKSANGKSDDDTVIYVSNLPRDVEEYDLYQSFRRYGPLSTRGIVFHQPKVGRPYAFVNYAQSESVEKILTENPDILLRGFKLDIRSKSSVKKEASSGGDVSTHATSLVTGASIKSETGSIERNKVISEIGCKSVWVGNVPKNINKDNLAQKFTAFGKLGKPPVSVYPSNKPNCCYAFVNFAFPESVGKVLSTKPKIYLGGNLLEIRASNANIDTHSESGGGDGRSVEAVGSITSNQEDEERIDPSRLWIRRIPIDVTTKDLYPLFAAFGKLSNPGISLHNSKNSRSMYAFVNYIDIESAEKVLRASEKNPFTFRGSLLQIVRSTSKTVGSDKSSDTASVTNALLSRPSQERTYFTIKVFNLPKNIPRTEVFNIFRFFGAIAEPPSIQIKNGEATVPFQQRDDAENLMRSKNGCLRIRNGTVTLVLRREYDVLLAPRMPSNHESMVSKSKTVPFNLSSSATRPSNVEPIISSAKSVVDFDDSKLETTSQWAASSSLKKDETNFAIQVRNVSKLSSRDLLLQYFKNQRRSNGGPVINFQFDDTFDRAVVVFENGDVMENVLSKKDGHYLENQQLFVSKLPPFSSNMLYVGNRLPDWVTLDRLKDFLDSRAQSIVDEIKFRDDNVGFLVRFKEDINVADLKKNVKERPLKEGDEEIKGDVWQFKPLVYPDAVIVYGEVPSRDSVMMYVEDYLSAYKQVANSNVRYLIEKSEKKDMCLLVFDDYQAVDCLPEDKIEINNVKFTWSRFYDCLGWLSADGTGNFLRKFSKCGVSKNLTPLQVEFLSADVANKFIKDQLAEQKLHCQHMIDKDKHVLRVTAAANNLSERIAKFILEQTTMFDVPLDGPKLKTWTEKSKDFKQLINSSNIATWFCFAETKSNISFVAASTIADSVRQLVEAFFDDHSLYDEILLNNEIETQYVKKFHEIDLKMKHTEPCHVKFDEYGRIVAHGTKLKLEMIKTDLKVLMSDVEVNEYVVTKPGMSTFFRDTNGLTEINRISDKSKSVIIREDQLSAENASSKVVTTGSVKLEGMLNNKLKITVVLGDMTCQKVDAIVNAANEDLEHIGGLAGAIVDKGGREIQMECRAYINRNGQLPVGGVFTSKPGQLPCKNIIHVVGPRWNGGARNEADNLRTAILNILDEGHKKGCQSVAIPAISTKIFGFPVHFAIPIIIKAVASTCPADKYYDKTVRDVRFVDSDDKTVSIFVQEIDTLQGFAKEIDSVSVSSAPRALLPMRVVKTLRPNATVQANPNLTNNFSFVFGGVSIEVLKNDIISVAKKCDVIVNTTSNNNFLGGGASSQAIMNAAGPAYVTDIQQRFPTGLNGLTVACTASGQLGCKVVYQISCPGWDPNLGINIVQAKVIDCLNGADKYKMTSIAFPAIGTGGLRYPANVVAKAMFDAAVSWIGSHGNSSVKSIYFVAFPQDKNSVVAFEQEVIKRNGSSSSPLSSTAFTNASTGSSDVPGSAVQIGDVKVEIVEGDITKENTDCFVCPSNEQLDLSKGEVAKAFLKIGGRSLKNVLAQCTPDFEEGIFSLDVSSVLSYKRMIFVDIQNERYTVEELFLRALKDANKLDMHSIAVPALGTGTLSRNVTDVVDMMLTTIQTFASTAKNLKLKLIRIVVFQNSTYQSFCQHISAMIGGGDEGGSSSKSMLGQMMDSVLKIFDKNKRTNAPVYPRNVEKRLTLYICGPKNGVVQAQKELDKICDEKCPSRTIIKEIIGSFNQQIIASLNARAVDFDVTLNVSVEQKKITIKGFKVNECQEWLVEVMDRLREELAEAPAKWFKRVKKTDDWQPMKFGVARIEDAFRAGKTTVDVEFEDGRLFTIDFKSLTVKSKDNWSIIVCELKRREIDDPIPVEWEWSGKMTTDQDYRLVALEMNSNEYITVSKAVFQTAAVTIQKIERVENAVKYKQYLLLKDKIKQSLPAGSVVERQLFHGTKNTCIPGICTIGFNRSMAGANGTAYGHGCYFARDCKYSAGYGKTIFYANVLTGTYTLGNASMLVAPDLDAAKGTKYDCVVDNQANPSIFVVFTDNHAYPGYLITCA